MTLILSHIGNVLPNHINECIIQSRKFYDGDIFLITDAECENIKNTYNLKIIKPNFNNEKFVKSKKINFYHYPSRDFWLFSLARFFFIEDLVDEYKLNNFIIYENDILIYSDLKEIIGKLNKIIKNIGFTIGDDTRATTGFSFFKGYEDLKKLNDDIVSIFEDPDSMKDIYNNYSKCCPSEMVFIRKIAKEKGYIQPLPLFPDENFFNELNFVFDPAAYGQFLGGTSVEYGGKENFIDETTYIGKKLINKDYTLEYKKSDIPYLIDKSGNKYKIFNLHVHSKKLYNFM